MSITTGYWKAVAEDDGPDWLIVKPDPDAGDNWYIATVHVAPDDGDAEDNARLIAAARELLEALQSCLGVLGHHGVGLATQQRAHAAIARATGAA